MMKKESIFIVLAIGAMVLLSSEVVLAQPSDKGHKKEKKEMMKKERFEKMFKDLNLTPEQQEKMKEQKNQHKENGKQFREKIKAQKDALKVELEKPQLDMDKINQIHEQIKALLIEQENNRLKGVLELRSILTPEQFAQFHKNMKECKGDFSKGKHKRNKKWQENKRMMPSEETSSEKNEE